MRFLNHYRCACGEAWAVKWPSVTWDLCPVCKTRCEPLRSEEREEPS